LHSLRILGLRQNLKQFVIAQKVESRKSCSFGFQILFQGLLNLVESIAVGLKHHLAAFHRCRFQRIGLIGCRLHTTARMQLGHTRAIQKGTK